MNKTDFRSVTVFVLASNETRILKETISQITGYCSPGDIEEIVIVVKNETCPAYKTALEITGESDGTVELYVQKSPDLVRCFAELPPLARGSHFVIMGADLEMDPGTLPVFIKEAKKHPGAVICAAKWLPGSDVRGYGFVHKLGSVAMNGFVRILFKKDVRDPFSIYQIYPVEVYRSMPFSSPENFLFEYTLLPLKNNVEYYEVRTAYNKVKERKSNFNLPTLVSVGLKFCVTAVKIRLKK